MQLRLGIILGLILTSQYYAFAQKAVPKAGVVAKKGTQDLLLEKPVRAQILFSYKNMDQKIRLFEVPTKMVLDLGIHGNMGLDTATPFGAPLPPEFVLRRGEVKYFAMVIENPSNSPLYFYASFHQIRPEEEAIGYVLNCLCINQLFVVPAKTRWYRIGSVVLTTNFPGDVIAFQHNVFGMTAKEVQAKKVENLINEGEKR